MSAHCPDRRLNWLKNLSTFQLQPTKVFQITSKFSSQSLQLQNTTKKPKKQKPFQVREVYKFSEITDSLTDPLKQSDRVCFTSLLPVSEVTWCRTCPGGPEQMRQGAVGPGWSWAAPWVWA